MTKLLILLPALVLLAGCAYNGPNECHGYYRIKQNACNPYYTDWQLCGEVVERYAKCLKEAKF